jgi:hypothetical protein
MNNYFTTFIFPFKFEQGDSGEAQPSAIRAKFEKEKNWRLENFKLQDSPEHYNEYQYFLPFVRNVLYNREAFTRDHPQKEGMIFLTREDISSLTIKYYDKEKKEKTFKTAISSIDLHLFDNGIGFLTITTVKSEGDPADFDTFLLYNDLARRVYPPFRNTKSLQDLKEKSILPSNIAVHGKDGALFSEESFKDDTLQRCMEKDVPFLSKVIIDILKPFEFNQDDKKDKKDSEVVYYTPFSDDRMFTLSFYQYDKENKVSSLEKLSRLTEIFSSSPNKTSGNPFKTDELWYRYIFVDGNKAGIANGKMMEDLISQHTYARWVNHGTLFGMSRYSFVCLCNSSGDFHEELMQHMKSVYYQMALLILLQRVMLIKFSEHIGAISQEFEHGEDVIRKAEALHGNFINQIAKYWFIEVTPQEQGIEIYNQWVNLLGLERLFQETHREISNMAEYIENRIESRRNRILENITYLGIPLAIVGIILSFWQVYEIDLFRSFPFVSKPEVQYSLNLLGAIVVIVIALSLLIYKKFKSFAKKWKS